ncbi:MAG TPA: alpha/beta hydrolase [Acidimicrobiales bacterium]
MPATVRVPSTGGVTLALHDLGGSGQPLLLCHATGFHALTWAPVAAELAGVAHGWAPDLRGHGDSTGPDDGDYAWRGVADDVLAVVDHLADGAGAGGDREGGDREGGDREGGGGGLVAAGHSMGGAALVMAELARPGTFAGLWVFEPILFPPPEGSGAVPGARPPGAPDLAEGARRRRRSFPDRETAAANYAAKPPLGTFDPAALRAYVDHGFRDVPGDGVELKCAPEVEARVFEGGRDTGAFARLGEVRCPVTVAAGREGGPAALAPVVAAALSRGRLETFPHLSHFGPMEDPAGIAAAVAAALHLA